MSRKIFWRSVITLCFVLTITIAARPLNDRYFEILKNLDIFATLFKEVNNHYVEEISPSDLIEKGIDEMLSSLDPYTNYIPAERIENYRILTTGEYSGIGAVVERKDGISTIVMPYEGFSAHEAGLRAGDQILAIDGVVLKDKSAEEVRLLIKGQSNSSVILTIKRYGQEEAFEATVKREKIAIESVPYAGMVNEHYGYVKLTNFTQNVGRNIGVKTLDLIEQGAKGIILDLRGNPGGLLHEAVNVSNVFIAKGQKIVTQKGKVRANDWTYKTLNDAIDADIPLVVLIDNGSASASEIVSGVVQDYDRGVLVGRKTFGKGLVQVERPLSYDAVVKITTAKYYTPTGRCIQAIDYGNRNPDGSVGKIPDSLKTTFKTSTGRLVYDGGGIDPDLEIDPTDYPPIVQSLVRDHHIFHYVTEYYYKNQDLNPERPSAITFSDADYEAFLKWVRKRDVSYTTHVLEYTDRLEEMAELDGNYEALKDEIDALKSAAKVNVDQDLLLFKKEIKSLIVQEIAGRFFFENGLIESAFKTDDDIAAAIKILDDPVEYARILNRN